MRSIRIVAAVAIFLTLPGLVVAQAERVPETQAQVKLTFAPVVRDVRPAVVNIYTQKVVRQRLNHPLLNDPIFRHFFGDQIQGLQRERVQNSLGSGVILRDDGVVVTNAHVIDGADDIKVVLSDKREYHATLVGKDTRTDLAVLKIDPAGEHLPTLALGDSDDLQVGDLVLAIGNPFGVGQTVTSGIVSATARTTQGISDYRFFIQTDAAINPGNSGGALVDLDGRLVGVNTAIFSKSGGSIGLGFAIPVNMVRSVVTGIVEHGKPIRPWFGGRGQPVTADIAQSLGMDRPTGVMVTEVWAGGPAEAGGLEPGDIVIAIDGKPVDGVDALRYRIATRPVGGTATITVLRDGRERQLTIALVAAPEEPPRQTTQITGRVPLAGATVANINPALAEEVGINALLEGPIILEVQPGSIAARLGFKPGDRPRAINGQPVGSVAEIKQALSVAQPGWEITFARGNKVLTVRAR